MATVNATARTSITAAGPETAASDVYLRVQLPNENTTVILVKSDQTMWEILNNICVKKELIPSQHKMKIVYLDGKEEFVEPENEISKYKNFERVILCKSIRPPRRPSVVTAKQTTIRVASQEFPKFMADNNDLLQQRNKAHSEYTAASKKSKGMKSLSMMIFKRSSAEITASFEAPDSPGSLSPSSEDARSLGSIAGAANLLEESEEEELDGVSGSNHVSRHQSLNCPPVSMSASHPALLSGARTGSVASMPPPAPNLKSTSLNHVVDTSLATTGKSASAAAISVSGTSDKGSGQNIPEAATQNSSVGSLTSLTPSITFTDAALAGNPLERSIRRRAVSNPVPNAGGSPLRRKTYRSRQRSNTDGVLQDAAGVLNDIASGDSQIGLLRVVMPAPEKTVVMFKAPVEQRMDNILDSICETNNLAPQDYTLKYGANCEHDVEMERSAGYYLSELKVSDVTVVAGERFYRTRCLSEDGKDVMLLQIEQGRLLVMAGTAEKLIERLTDDEEKDNSYLDTILLTFRSFMKPEDFLQYLIGRFNCVPPENPTEDELSFFQKMKGPVQKGVFNTIAWWVEHHWHDFGVSQELRNEMECFVEEIDYSNFEKEWLHSLIKQQAEKYEEMFAYYRAVERRGKTMESMFMELTPEELGQQLCLHDFKLFRNIHPIEFLNQIWKKKVDPKDTDVDTSPGGGGSPCLTFFSDRFDKESYWAAMEIVSQKDMKKRVNVLKKFILTAKVCLDNHNFFTTFALVFGLNLTPVSRLKKTWEALDVKVRALFSEVEKVCDPSRNFKNYKDAINAAKPPIVPFLPIYLKDLTFINDGNPSNVQGMINFEKLRMMGKRVKDITSLSGSGSFKFEANPAAQNYLAKPPVERSMTKLKEMSLECEK